MIQPIKIAICQTDPKLGDIEHNLSVLEKFVSKASSAHADLACFPELNLSGYMYSSKSEIEGAAITLESSIYQTIQEISASTSVHIICSFIEEHNGSFFNSTVLVGPDRIQRIYRKVHLPLIGADRFLEPGPSVFPTFKTNLGKVGINICYDQSFPESARICALNQAEIVIVPGNWNTDSRQVLKLLPPARAFENHIHYLVVNRVGMERGSQFIGQSALYDCNGTKIHNLSSNSEEMKIVEVDLAFANKKKVVKVPNEHEVDRINDRRPNLYGILQCGVDVRNR